MGYRLIIGMTLRAKCHKEYRKEPRAGLVQIWLSHYHLHTLKNSLKFNCCTKFLKRTEERALPPRKEVVGCSIRPGGGSAFPASWRWQSSSSGEGAPGSRLHSKAGKVPIGAELRPSMGLAAPALSFAQASETQARKG